MEASTKYLVLTKKQIEESIERQTRYKPEEVKKRNTNKQRAIDDYDPVIKKASFYELGPLASRGIKKEIDYKKGEH